MHTYANLHRRTAQSSNSFWKITNIYRRFCKIMQTQPDCCINVQHTRRQNSRCNLLCTTAFCLHKYPLSLQKHRTFVCFDTTYMCKTHTTCQQKIPFKAIRVAQNGIILHVLHLVGSFYAKIGKSVFENGFGGFNNLQSCIAFFISAVKNTVLCIKIVKCLRYVNKISR